MVLTWRSFSSRMVLPMRYGPFPHGMVWRVLNCHKVNCPVGAEAFYNKLEIKDKKLVLYPVRPRFLDLASSR